MKKTHEPHAAIPFRIKILSMTALLYLILSVGFSMAKDGGKSEAFPDIPNGIIDSIQKDNIVVIDDRLFNTDKNTKYFALSGNKISRNRINSGDRVSFKADKSLLLKEMYVTKESEREKKTASPQSAPLSQDMYLENGVWKAK